MSMPELTQHCRNSLQYPDAKQIETPNATIDFDEPLEINNRESVQTEVTMLHKIKTSEPFSVKYEIWF